MNRHPPEEGLGEGELWSALSLKPTPGPLHAPLPGLRLTVPARRASSPACRLQLRLSSGQPCSGCRPSPGLPVLAPAEPGVLTAVLSTVGRPSVYLSPPEAWESPRLETLVSTSPLGSQHLAHSLAHSRGSKHILKE